MKKLIHIIKIFLSLPLIRSTRRTFGQYYYKLISSSYLLSMPTSMLSPLSLMRERRAVMAGKGGYYANLNATNKKNRVGLRRNIHRLEKGLIMKPRRASFARDYIAETVDWYERAVGQYKTDRNSYEKAELNWAQNVLAEYFQTVKSEGVIKEAKAKFEKIAYISRTKDSKPFVRVKPNNLPTYDQLLSLSQYRRSVRYFTNKKVKRSAVDKALLVARQSPTACNRLPYEFRIFDNPRIVKKVANIPMGTGGYADNIPVIAVVVGKLDSYFSARDRHAIYVDSSLASMSFAYALEVQGLSTCMINWPDFEPLERKMQKFLNLGVSDRPIMLIAIGYADKKVMVPRSIKKELDNIRRYN